MATANTEIGVKINVDGSSADKSVGSIKKQLKEATASLIEMRDKFGDTSKEAVEAAKKVAGLKDAIGDAKEMSDLFNPDTKFKALSGVLSAVAGGFAAVQGAQALFGSESKELEKTLVKVQGAMAFSQGIDSVLQAGESFKKLGSKVMSFSIIQKIVTAGQWLWNAAMAANPIGAIVAAIAALLVAGAMLIKFFIDSSNESKKNEAAIKENAKALEAQKVAAESSATQLDKNQKQQVALAKANGATTKSIRELESKLIDEKIAYVNSTKEAAKNTYEKNKNALANLKASGASDELIDAQRKVTNDSVEEYNKQIENSYKANEEKKDLNNKHIVEIAAENTKANDDTLKKQKEFNDKQLAKNKEYQDKLKAQNKAYKDETDALELENYLSTIKNETERAVTKIQVDFEREKTKIKNSVADKEIQNALLAQLEIKAQNDIDKIRKDDYDKRQATLKKENEDLFAEMLDSFDKEFALKQKSLLDQAALDLTNSANTKLSFDERLAAVADREAKEKDIVFASAEEKTAYEKANADARIAIGEAEHQAKVNQLQAISGLLGSLSELVGKESKTGKAIAIAKTTIDTYQAAIAAYKSMAGIPTVGPVLGAVAAGAAVASGIAAVKKIIAVPLPNGGSGGSVPSGLNIPSAPLAPQLQTTSLNQGQINQLSSATTRAFVLESDVSGNQERITRLNRASRIN